MSIKAPKVWELILCKDAAVKYRRVKHITKRAGDRIKREGFIMDSYDGEKNRYGTVGVIG